MVPYNEQHRAAIAGARADLGVVSGVEGVSHKPDPSRTAVLGSSIGCAL
jgi:hypothetical protein